MRLFNQQFGANYEIVELGGTPPDVKCQDLDGRALNLEITETGDRSRDIQAATGRSEHRNVEHFGPSSPGIQLRGNVLEQAAERISKKLLLRYEASTALAVRDTSSVEWDWSLVVDELKTRLDLAQNSYEGDLDSPSYQNGAIPAYLKWLLSNALCLIRLLHLRQMGLIIGELSLSYSKGKPTEAGLICQTHPKHWRYKR